MYYIASVIRKTKMKYEVQLTHIVDENALIPLDPLLIRMVNQSNCEEIKGLKI